MYGDLRSKLEMYKNNRNNPDKKPKKVSSTGLDIHELLEGSVCENEDGKFFVIERKYPLLHVHGGYSLGHLLKIDLGLFSYVFSGIGDNLAVEELVFLDTETTGLSSGVGTVAFLIGTGFFEKDCFVMRQYFMRDYDEELAVLRELNRQLSRFKGLVTFNGKAFDWNLLSSRFAFNRIRMGMKEPIHLDLLFPSRRIWKLKLESCRLTNLEENILGERRIGDIPGAMIPATYFKYLEDKDATDIKKIIVHNELDILTMLSLMCKIHDMLEKPLSETDGEKELLGIGKIFEGTEKYQTMIDCYKMCKDSENGYVKETATVRLSNAYKRNMDYDNAVKQWESMIMNESALSIYPFIELAKFYEHKRKDIGRALKMVEKAIHMFISTGLYNKAGYADLKKRHDRLKRKEGKTNA